MKALINKKSRMRWSKSITTESGLTRNVTVREISNGFIAQLEQYGGEEEEFIDKEVYFKENPLKDIEPELDSSILLDFMNPPKQLL